MGARRPEQLDLHPFPACFVCGPERRPGDGLGIIPGHVGDGRVGAVFVPPSDDRNRVPVPYLTAALDCPSGWSVYRPGEIGVLGTIDIAVSAVPSPGERLIVVGESLGREGRRRHAGSALYTASGVEVARAAATWVDLR